MADVKNKLILKQIAKEFAKSILLESEPLVHFDGTGLTAEECDYIYDELRRIGNRITDEPISQTTEQIVDKYFE